MATATNSMPMTCFRSTLPGPDRGKADSQLGLAVNNKYGKAMPAPMTNRVRNAKTGGWVAVQATVAPNSGPVHGVESTAVKTPIKNEPPAVSLVGLKTVRAAGNRISNNPIMPTPMPPTIRPRRPLSHHFSNCSPQSSRSNSPPTPAIKMPKTP